MFAAASTAYDDHPRGVGRLTFLCRRRHGDQRRPARVGVTQQDKHHCLVGPGRCWWRLASGWTTAGQSSHLRQRLHRRRRGVEQGWPGAKTCARSCGLEGARWVLYRSVAGWCGFPGAPLWLVQPGMQGRGKTTAERSEKTQAHNLLYCMYM